MIARESRHARLVTGLKLVLPLLGLGILATVFLLPRQIDPTAALPYADIDVEELTRDPQVGAPRFATMTGDGTAMTAAARIVRASPAGPGEWMTAEHVHVTLEAPDGQASAIDANEARLDRAGGTLVLTGAVHMTSAAGYRLWAEHLTAATDRTWVEGTGPIRAEGPPGQITSQGMILRHQDARPDTEHDTDIAAVSGGHLLVFTGGVKLLYQPDSKE